jgi:hypothetical protein
MRTTVTLEEDLAAKLKEYAHRRKTSFKEALNAVLRRGLTSQAAAPAKRRFMVEVHPGRLRTGIDPGKLNQLADQLETDDFMGEVRARR